MVGAPASDGERGFYASRGKRRDCNAGALQQGLKFALQLRNTVFAFFVFSFFFRRPARESSFPKRFYLPFVQCGDFSEQFCSSACGHFDDYNNQPEFQSALVNLDRGHAPNGVSE